MDEAKERHPAAAPAQGKTAPPGEGDGIEDAAREAAAEMEKDDLPYAGRGDAG